MSASVVDCDAAPIVQLGRNESFVRLDSTREMARAYYGFGVALNLVCLLVWLSEKRNYERTRIRPTLFVWMAVLCSLAQMSCGVLQSFTEEGYPCWLGVVLLMLIIPFGATSIFGRYMLFNFLSRFAQSAADVQNKLIDAETSSVPTSGSHLRRGFCQRMVSVLKLIAYPDQKATTEEDLFDLKLMASKRGVFGMAVVLCLPFIVFAIVILSTDLVIVYCYNCAFSSMTFNLLIATAVVEMFIVLAVWYGARRIKGADRWGLKTECSYCIAWVVFSFVAFLVSVFDSTQVTLQPYTHLLPMSIGLWLNVIQQTLVQVYLARKAKIQTTRASNAPATCCQMWCDPRLFYLFWTTQTVPSMNVQGKKMQVADDKSVASEISTTSAAHHHHGGVAVSGKYKSARDELEELLDDQTLAVLFEKHLMGEFGVESLFFLQQAEAWKRQYFDISPAARVARARRIFKAYVQSSGLYTVNLPWSICDKIRQTMKEGDEDIASNAALDDVPHTLFDDAIWEIRRLLTAGAVLRFKHSPEYRKSQRGGHNQAVVVVVDDASASVGAHL